MTAGDGPTGGGGRCYEITHRTVYRYSDDVTSSYGRGFMTPRDSSRQRCLSHELVLDPDAADSSTSRDAYGNISSYFHVTERHQRLSVTSQSVVEDLPVPVRFEIVAIDRVFDLLGSGGVEVVGLARIRANAACNEEEPRKQFAPSLRRVVR